MARCRQALTTRGTALDRACSLSAQKNMLRYLPNNTTSQLDFLDGLADKINAHGLPEAAAVAAAKAPQEIAGAAWAPVTDPLRRVWGSTASHALAMYAVSARAWRRPPRRRALLLALDHQSRERWHRGQSPGRVGGRFRASALESGIGGALHLVGIRKNHERHSHRRGGVPPAAFVSICARRSEQRFVYFQRSGAG